MNWRASGLLVWAVASVALAEASAEAADAALKEKRWEEAVRLSTELIASAPKDPSHLLRLASALHGQGKYAEATDALKRAEKAGGNPIMVAVRLGKSYARLGQKDAAFAALDRALTGGFTNTALIKSDPDFQTLRGDPRLEKAIAKAERNARPCSFDPEFRQFDFWIGEWDVTSGGATVGQSRVELILEQCVLLENWESASGSSGKSFNLYDRETKKWRQTWVDSSGSINDYSGGLKDGAMVLTATTVTPAGKKAKQRMTFTKVAPDRVRQFIEQTEDGKRWTVVFDGLYAPRLPKGGQPG